jgi:chitinase
MYRGKPFVALYDTQKTEPVVSPYYWAPYSGCIPPPSAACPFLDKLLPDGEATFLAVFTPSYMSWVPLKAYSYSNLCDALKTPVLSGFARSGNSTQDKREIAAFFANVAIETSYLTFVDEKNHSASDKDYHGRGSLQITTPPIYQECGAALGVDLSGQPQLASQDQLVWKTGLWYWMLHANPSVTGVQICHAAIAQGDFGHAIRIINPTCRSAAERVAQYRKNCMLLQVDPGTMTGCP